MESIKNISNNNITTDLKKDYQANLKDSTFKDLVTKFHITEQMGMLNNSKLMDSTNELKIVLNAKDYIVVKIK